MPSHKDIKSISIKGAKVHNLKNISLEIPRNKLVVITGLSGSGKSSLAFDTLFAEGQRRYVESLSSYARQFLGRINKPDVESIKGIPPAIAIEQKMKHSNPRSTVGTSTEIYDYIKLLFSKIGKTYSPLSGTIVKKHSISDVMREISDKKKSEYFMILFPLHLHEKIKFDRIKEILIQQGYSRILIKNRVVNLHDAEYIPPPSIKTILVIVDRISYNNDEDTLSRIADSLQIAFTEGKGNCIIRYDDGKENLYSDKFEADGITFREPDINLFSFNNPVGACEKCEGFGSVMGIDPDLVIPDKSLSIFQDAVVCWKGEKMQKWKEELIKVSEKIDFPIHRPYFELSQAEHNLLWTGNKYFSGLSDFFKYVESKAYKIQYRVLLSRYRGKTTCNECGGSRLRKDTIYIKIADKNITELVNIPLSELRVFFNNLNISKEDEVISSRILKEINSRLKFICNLGLDYLTLNRNTSTLSGGEFQRINLANSLGSSLVGALYILDEPSIGLHQRDTHLLIKTLKELRDMGNSVVVVEHDEEIIRSSDEIIDIGPFSGRFGGEIVFQGHFSELKKDSDSLTKKYLSGEMQVEVPTTRRKWKEFIEIRGASGNNLKNINVKFPLNIITVITGVSGSGKSTLLCDTLYPALLKKYSGSSLKPKSYADLSGSFSRITAVELIDQNPIGKSTRSNPVTYVKAYDEIRNLFFKQKLSQISGFQPKHFSFNVDGGRCDECQGEGIIKVEMQFMADISLICESCKGHRFKDEILEVRYRDKNIHDILEMSIDDAINFFGEGESTDERRIVEKLSPLIDVGLGYLKMGQSSNTLSGGESQRVKLASFLGKDHKQPVLFIFDEPTTGLHFHDINKLLFAFNSLIKKGHTVIIIEHNPDVIKCADWIIDLGPDGGNKGGGIVFEGIPEEIVKSKVSHTGKFLISKLK